MKKVVMLILCLLLAVPAYSATINLTAASSKDITNSGSVKRLTYTTAESVTTGVTQVFALTIPISRGWV